MHVTKKSLDPYTLDAHIALSKEELTGYLKLVTDELAQQVTVGGFRKGKAPKERAEKELNGSVVRQEALERALGESFTTAATQERWDVMRTSDLKVLKNDADALEYSIRVVLWPTVTLPDLTAVKMARKNVDVSDQEVQESLDTIQNMRATFLDKTGPAASGDRVEVDFDTTVGGISLEGGQSKNHPLIIGGKSFMPGFEEALIGLAAGDAKRFSLVAPDDYYEHRLAGKKVDFAVTIRRVQTVLKPAADDAFTKSLGKFENLVQLKNNLREGIVREKEAKEQQRLRLAILDTIIAKGEIPVSEAMVKSELDGMVKQFGEDLHARGIELAMYLARMKKTEDDLRKEWEREAERQVRIMLVIREVAKAHRIAVPPEEIEEAVQQTVAELMRTGQVPEGQIDPDRLRSALEQRLLTDKTLAFLEQTCAVTAA